jgi:hypothetical protein
MSDSDDERPMPTVQKGVALSELDLTALLGRLSSDAGVDLLRYPEELLLTRNQQRKLAALCTVRMH